MFEPIAYGVLGLKPHEFGKLQPREIKIMLDVHKIRTDNENWKQAYFTWWMAQPHVARTISIAEVLGPFNPEKTAEETEKLRLEKEYYSEMDKELRKNVR